MFCHVIYYDLKLVNSIENTPRTIYITSLIMQNSSFGSDTDTILRMFSTSDDIIECLPSVPRRESTQKLLGSIYDDIQWACPFVHAAKQNNGSTRHNLETRPIRSVNAIPKPKVLRMSIIPKNVSDYIYQNSSYAFHFSTRVKNRTVKVIFVTSHTDPTSHINTYSQYFDRMMIWFHIAFKYSSDACGANISVYIYDTPLQKSLPKHRSEILGKSHANTAYTYACPTMSRVRRTTRSISSDMESEIILFRHEEWFKVFIHETFHMLGMDFSGIPNIDAARNVVRDRFPVESNMEICEAYTETWATIINTCICSHFCLEQLGKVTFVSYVEVLLGFEAAWRIFQMHKILRFMGLTYSDLYLKSKKAKLVRTNLYREDTNIFAYYVITAHLLVNYGDFMEWCSVNNGVGGNMSFHNTDANIMSFARLIVKLQSTLSTKNSIKEIGSKRCFNAILDATEVVEHEPWVSETMRMSVCEMC